MKEEFVGLQNSGVCCIMPRRKVISNDLREIVAAYEAVSKPSEVHHSTVK